MKPTFDWVTPASPPAAPETRLEQMYPEEVILAAAGRISAARRRVHGSRAIRLACVICSTPLTARERRKPCPVCKGRNPR